MFFRNAVGRIAAGVGMTVALGGTAAAQAVSPAIDPPSYEATIGVGGSITIHKTITVGSGGASNVDVFFLGDNTGSMGGTVGSMQAGATAILNNFGTGFQFGVGSYLGDPSEGTGSGPTGYFLQQALTTDKTDVQNAINSWFANYGGDTPEANFFALQQVANTAGWRAGAQRIIVWFGDAPSHTETTTMAQAIAALTGNNVKVVAFNNTGGSSGIDGSYGGANNQASTIVGAAGGSLTNNFSAISGSAFVTAVNNAISAATATIDLNFFDTYGGGGLGISYECTDPLGCMDVPAGESRTFDVTITGLAPGDYYFDVGALGVDALEADHITVTGESVIPEPTSMVLLASGLVGMAGAARRRRRTS